jgi:hypothetical protein
LGGDTRAVWLGVVEFHQTAGVEVEHGSIAAAGEQSAQGFARRAIAPNTAGSLHKVGLARAR